MDRANFSIHVTPANVEEVIPFVRAFGLNIDYVRDNLQYADPYIGELYLILSISSLSQQFTCVEVTPDDFVENWVLHDNHLPNSFPMNIIERKV